MEDYPTHNDGLLGRIKCLQFTTTPQFLFSMYMHTCVYILTVTNELILSLWLVQCGILTSMSTRRLKIYSTATIAVSVLVFVGEALLLCPGSAWTVQSQPISRPAALLRLAKTHPTSQPAGTPYSTIRCLGNVAILAAPDGNSPAGHHTYIANRPEVVDGTAPNHVSLQRAHECYLGCDHTTYPYDGNASHIQGHKRTISQLSAHLIKARITITY